MYTKGTAEIFAKKANVFTFSTHGRTNYPFKKNF
jgi:acetoin utilization deacetylase AcuC-like enzyme